MVCRVPIERSYARSKACGVPAGITISSPGKLRFAAAAVSTSGSTQFPPTLRHAIRLSTRLSEKLAAKETIQRAHRWM